MGNLFLDPQVRNCINSENIGLNHFIPVCMVIETMQVKVNSMTIGKPIWGKQAITMTLHTSRSRKFHRTWNTENISSGLKDMDSGKSGHHWYQIWQVFSPWASPYETNGQMTLPLHNHRCKQSYRPSNGGNLPSDFKDMPWTKSGPAARMQIH